MVILRAMGYFFEEALLSLWRSRLVNALSVITIAVSLFVLGAFLTVASNMTALITQWSQKVQVTFYLGNNLQDSMRADLTRRFTLDAAVEKVVFVSREEALFHFRKLFPDLRSLPEDLGENPFPASLEVTLLPEHQSTAEVERLVRAFEKAPGIEEAQYDLLWIERLSHAIRLVRGVGLFLGGVLVLAGIFTISNTIRLTVYLRQDELDIMRLVGATRAYVRGPFVAEGILQGGFGGVVAVTLLWLAFRILVRDVVAASDLLGRSIVFLPQELCLSLILGGMLVGVIGSLVSLGRSSL